ncbi:hypothetical protein [uncultured Acetatifactor sp.]|jgi:hypothetical protein|uniref:hypothetical protein n=1 Tax=uncultured Acetatifactor sp. TaxID=1671927 RepID=UPI00262441AB|nr:hypothetical protein [uncultured Acetatifactor sp.]
MKGAKRVILGLAGLGMAAALGGCGILRGAGNTATDLNPEDDTYYTMWIHSGPGSSYYTEYEDNPAVKYAETMTWGEEGKSIFIDFVIPPANKEPDDLQNMYINGNLTHVLDGVICDSADIMYANNRIIDLTEYVNQYMPNYKKVLDTVEDVRKSAVFNIDGEEKILGIVTVNESYKDVNFGYEYRRDWIVKYGSNPQTGAAFSGGYTDESDPDSWEDDVVFPSGGSDPVYISDWEWMFGIFETAMEDMGIDDGYCISMYYPGYMWSGGLCSSFGGGTPMFYVNDQGQACFGGVSDSFRTYLECLSAWYEKGWLDKTFDQKTSDAHYAIDSAKIHQGKIGIWYGQQSTLGNRIYNQNDPSQTPLAEGIFVAGAPMPINDIYGPEECRNVIPDCTAAGVGMQGSPVYITTKAVEDGKDIAALCAFFDYFYTEEGAVVKTVGLNQEQVQASGSDFYEKNGLTEGAYTNVSDGEYRYRLADALALDGGNLRIAVSADKMPGLALVKSVDKCQSATFRASMDAWIKYPNIGLWNGTPGFLIEEEDSKAIDKIRTKLLNYMDAHTMEFIKGQKDVTDDKTWEDWCTMLRKQNYEKALNLVQPYVEKYDFRQP